MLAKIQHFVYNCIQKRENGGIVLFVIGDYIVHPMHGAGVIENIVSRRISGDERDYYVLKLPAGDMVVMVPVDGCENIGVRPVISHDEAVGILDSFPKIEVNMTQNWNKRYRENMDKIKSGNLLEVGEVVKGLMCRDLERGLSTGERKMLHSAKQILISELVIALDTDYDQVEQKLSAAI